MVERDQAVRCGEERFEMTSLLDEARSCLGEAVEVRREVHRHPEIGLDLPRTQQTVLEALDGLGLDIEAGKTTTSVVATLAGGHPGPTVLLRADMDALPMPEDTGLDFASEVPGAMHACGHDSHVAMLTAAAGLLARHRDDLHGNVRFMFQPGEEGYAGATLMIEEGVLDPAPAAAFAIHVASYRPTGLISTRPGPLCASSDKIVMRVTGKGGHASAPHRARDPIPVACEIVQAFQTMITRRFDVFDPAVLTVAHVEAGSTNNVIPETAFMEGTVRALSDTTRREVLDGARRIVEGVAGAHGLEGAFSVEMGYPATINDDEMAAFALEVAGEALGREHVERMEDPIMGAEDFSYVLQRVPGAMVTLGAAPPDHPDPAPNHSNRMLLDEGAFASGIALHAALALRFLDGSRPA
jgi:amidohydrolase